MKFDHRSVASIFFHEAGGDEFRGTGFLVTDKHVVTCAHVLPGNTWNRNGDCRDVDGEFNQIGGLIIHFGGYLASAEERIGAGIACSQDDLALITLDTPVALPPVLLVSGVADYKGIQGRVIGFSKAKRKLVKRPVRNQITATLDFHTNHILNIQLHGGLPRGMSGSPFIVKYKKGGACFAVASLGGEDKAISTLIGAEDVIEFLKTNKVPLKTVPASDCRLSELLSRKTWVAIAVIVILLGTAFGVLRKELSQPDSTKTQGNPQVSLSTTSNEQKLAACTVDAQRFSDEQIRNVIWQALHAEIPEPEKAFCLVLGMGDSAAKREECNRLYNWATQNKPDLAVRVREQCPGIDSTRQAF